MCHSIFGGIGDEYSQFPLWNKGRIVWKLSPSLHILGSMKQVFAALLAAAFVSGTFSPAAVAEDRAGHFDYYVLALSWAPSWCRLVGDPRDSTSCDQGRGAGFTVHGLWPQYERGWPENCATTQPNPPRAATRAMADLTGSSGLAWHQWRKHGRCTGLSATDYFRTTRLAAQQIVIPPIFSKLEREVRLPARVVEDAFIEANPALTRNGITVTCRGPDLQEVRICLTRDLEPRDCAPDLSRDCSRNMLMPPPS